MISLGAAADPGLRPDRHPAVLHRAADRCGLVVERHDHPGLHAEHLRVQPGLRATRTSTTRRRSRFALGIVVFIAVYIFLFATRKRGSICMTTTAPAAPARRARPRPTRRPRGAARRSAAVCRTCSSASSSSTSWSRCGGCSWPAPRTRGPVQRHARRALVRLRTSRCGSNLSDLFTYNDGIYLRWLGNSLLYAVDRRRRRDRARRAGRLRLRQVRASPAAELMLRRCCSARSWCR